VQVVWIGGLEFGLPPLGVVIFEYVEDIVLLDSQLFLGVGVIVVEGHEDLEERHGCGGGYANRLGVRERVMSRVGNEGERGEEWERRWSGRRRRVRVRE